MPHPFCRQTRYNILVHSKYSRWNCDNLLSRPRWFFRFRLLFHRRFYRSFLHSRPRQSLPLKIAYSVLRHGYFFPYQSARVFLRSVYSSQYRHFRSFLSGSCPWNWMDPTLRTTHRHHLRLHRPHCNHSGCMYNPKQSAHPSEFENNPFRKSGCTCWWSALFH